MEKVITIMLNLNINIYAENDLYKLEKQQIADPWSDNLKWMR